MGFLDFLGGCIDWAREKIDDAKDFIVEKIDNVLDFFSGQVSEEKSYDKNTSNANDAER